MNFQLGYRRLQSQVKLLISHMTTNETMADIAAAKAAVREEVAENLKTLTPLEKKRQSLEVFKKLIALESFRKSKRFSTFLSIDNEIDTEPIVRQIFQQGGECFVPRYNKQGMQMVKLKSMEDWETLPVTSWGIKQPSYKDTREDALSSGGLDFIVVPGVAFTKSGLRLGHGGGYYDKFLEGLKKTQEKAPILVAVAFKEQILEDLPVTERDVVIDTILCAD